MRREKKREGRSAAVVVAALLFGLVPGTGWGGEVAPTDGEILEMARGQAGERWYGVYVLGKKVGWQKDAWAEKEGRICNDLEFLLEMAFLGTKTRVSVVESACYAAVTPFGLVSYKSTRDEDGRKTTIEAAVREEGILFTIDTTTQRREMKAEKDADRLLYALPWAPLKRLQPGDSVASRTFDEMTGQTRWQKVTLKSREERNVMGRKQAVCLLLVEDETGMKLDALVTGEGIVLEGSLGANLRIVLEDKDVARRTDVDLLDLYSSSFVPAKGSVDYGRATRISRMKLKLTGRSQVVLAQSARQKVLEKGENTVLLEVTACPAAPGDGASPEPEHSACNADVPCDVTQYLERAAEVTKGADTALDKARRLSRWVHDHLEYHLGAGGGTADQILQNGKGDCTEFSKALVLLARAAGLPARPISGIVLASDAPVTFGYHAWVEVWIEGKGWIALDPTWGTFPVDAAHVVFDTDEGLQMATHLGDLSVEILEVDYADLKKGLRCD